MATVEDILDNAFGALETIAKPTPKEKLVPNYRKRYQLLSYGDVTKLSDVMETTVPVHGKGNFPALEVTPSRLVQMVRNGLSREGIRVPNVRLNGSAATHVLSEHKNHAYKDLDLIFAVDLSGYSDGCSCNTTEMNNNNNNNSRFKCAPHKSLPSRKYAPSHRRLGNNPKTPLSGPNGRTLPSTAPSTPHVRSRNPSPAPERPTELVISSDDGLDAEVNRTCTTKPSNRGDLSPCPTSPRTVVNKDGVECSVEDLDYEDGNDKDSGYTSSGSSVSSLPISPAGSWVYQAPIRSRTHSLDSSSSVTSSSSYSRSDNQTPKQRDTTTPTGAYLDVHAAQFSGRRLSSKEHSAHDFCSSKDVCWQKIKDVVIAILRDLLPVGVSRARMTDAVLTDAYVQKMVKINNDVDRWSLISLNNNTGRNLELKFVENMRRQYEFSVDSFQIILDSYQRFKIVSRTIESSRELKLSPNFYPSVLAESVYGDFAAALRHLRHRRICTHSPEEIRGGGLLRYCNLLVRDYTAGEVPGHEAKSPASVEEDPLTPSPKDDFGEISYSVPLSLTSQSYSSSGPEDVERLEQLMCSRFFIDFSEFPRQQQKLLSYLDSHFSCEDDLKFQYLLMLRRVVDQSTICLMSDERSMIVDFITKLAQETLAKSVGSSPKSRPSAMRQPQYNPCFVPRSDMAPPSYQVYESSTMGAHNPYYQPPMMPQSTPHSHYPVNSNTNNNCNVPNTYYPHYPSPTVKVNYAPQNCYPVPNGPPVPNSGPCYPTMDPSYYPQFMGYQPPLTCCPCCHAVYPQISNPGPYSERQPPPMPQPPQQSMSAMSAPFYPSYITTDPPSTAPRSEKLSDNIQTQPQGPRSKTVYLSENAKLFYTPATRQETQPTPKYDSDVMPSSEMTSEETPNQSTLYECTSDETDSSTDSTSIEKSEEC